jgi:hypothetical protein
MEGYLVGFIVSTSVAYGVLLHLPHDSAKMDSIFLIKGIRMSITRPYSFSR